MISTRIVTYEGNVITCWCAMKKAKVVLGNGKRSVLGFVGMAVIIAFLVQPSAMGQITQIFRIGSFDHSELEFHGGNPSSAVLYIVGPSASSKSWFARQYVDESIGNADVRVVARTWKASK